MNYLLIFTIVVLVFSACNSNGFQCVDRNVAKLKERTGFDYYKFSLAFEDYMVSNHHLENRSLESWKEMLEAYGYCDIDYRHFISKVNNSFATSPTVGGAFVKCNEGIFAHLDLDSLADYGPEYTLSLAKQLEERDFSIRANKIFFVYQTNVLYSTMCLDTSRASIE